MMLKSPNAQINDSLIKLTVMWNRRCHFCSLLEEFLFFCGGEGNSARMLYRASQCIIQAIVISFLE